MEMKTLYLLDAASLIAIGLVIPAKLVPYQIREPESKKTLDSPGLLPAEAAPDQLQDRNDKLYKIHVVMDSYTQRHK